jgi:hypothetical protein
MTDRQGLQAGGPAQAWKDDKPTWSAIAIPQQATSYMLVGQTKAD